MVAISALEKPASFKFFSISCRLVNINIIVSLIYGVKINPVGIKREVARIDIHPDFHA